jgi:hypothetical protein
MKTNAEELFDKAKLLKEMLVSRACGSFPDEEEFIEVRKEILDEPGLKNYLPSFLYSTRTIDEFWFFIGHKFGHYDERRHFLNEQFEPLLTFLEENSRQTLIGKAVTPLLTAINSMSVQEAWSKALERQPTDPEGALTAARTLLEAVCKFILDENGQQYDSNDDLPDLYKKVAIQLNLSPSQHEEQIFKQILGGVSSVVTGLGSLRNKLGDAHGKGKVGVKPSSRHAQLAVNLAGSVAIFLIQTWEAKSSK